MKKLLSIFILLAMASGMFAQEIELEWTKRQLMDESSQGLFDYYLGGNAKYVYAKLANVAAKPKNKNKIVTLVAYDKETFKQAFSAKIVDKGGKNGEAYKELDYFRSVVFDESIYIFWKKKNRQAEELWVESFSSELKRQGKLKKINEIKFEKGGNAVGAIFVLSNRKAGEKVFIGNEIIPGEGENVRVSYKLLNNELEISDASEKELPIVVKSKRKSNFLTSSYELGDDGKIYVYSNVSLSKEEMADLPKGASGSYSILTIIDAEKANANSISIRSEGKNIFDFGTEITPNGTALYGFFCDLEKDPKGRQTHGIFYGMVDKKSNTLMDMNFSYFDKEFLKELFANDTDKKIKEKKEEGKKKSKKKIKAEKAAEEDLGWAYEIEVVKHRSDNGNIMLFCTKESNYTTQHCTTTQSGTTCYTVYHCDKDDVTVFELGKGGKIESANHIDREINYTGGWNIKDISVLEQDGNFVVFYNNQYTDQTTKNEKSKQAKSKEMRQTLFEYAVLNTKNHTFEKVNYKLNKVNAPPEEVKTINVRNIEVIDNVAYVSSFASPKMKTGGKIATALACVACFPLGVMFIAGKPFAKTQQGYFGQIKVAK